MTDISQALRELLLERAAGKIDAEQFERRQAELHASLLAEKPTASPSRRWPLLVVSAGVVALAIGAYVWKTGGTSSTPAALPSMPPAAQGAAVMTGTPQQTNGGDLKMLAVRLAEKLAKNPANGEGWALLAQTYVELRQYKEADQAFSKAASLGQADTRLLVEWVDARVTAQNHQWDKTAHDTLAKALAAEPKNLKALTLAGTEAADKKDYKGAIAQWKKVVAAAPADSPEAKLAQNNINEVQQVMSGKAPAPASPPAGTAAAGGASVAGTLSLAPELQGKFPPGTTVFIVAKNAEGNGPPLAARKYTVAELPVIFSLTNDDAMSAQSNLSSVSEVQLVARISKSGDAIPQPGDVFSKPERVKVGATNIKLQLGSR